MSRREVKLTTTSYSLLGLLAIKPWTTYELAKQMERGLGLMWPRARSKIFEEPKKLVAEGLARSKEEQNGGRTRTVYSITPKGRRALAAWLTQPGNHPMLECEQVVKVFFAEHGTKAGTLAQIDAALAWADEEARRHATIARAYAEGRGAFQDRLPIHTLTGRFIADFGDMVGRWAEWARAIVEQWPDDPGRATANPETLEEVIARAEAWTARRRNVTDTAGYTSPCL